MKTVRRTAWTLIAVLALMASSGCGRTGTVPWDRSSSRPSSSTGQSLEQAQERLASIDGLTDASITQGDTLSGLNKRHEVSIEGSVHDSAAVPGIIERVARLGWSVGDVEPDTGVFIRLRTKPQLVIGEVAEQQGWSGSAYATSTEELKELVLIPSDALEDHFGRWPGGSR
ncbi:hypothetical protein FB462_1350 [Curtobacterium citreum]|uniref:hypothetical protein n=1 Tax=Curtobacterium sp. csp3 TaxID=2588937 RepID=UPI0011689A9D|nr:hypothetical protein [Curtobacterium sp. csp3]QKS11964.1 hypothetical protein HUN60_01490 [Curtobacterium sp. csp3]TQJ27495.1 hypothetical protein FB462_1350 [Curtobacterium citreum]